MALNAPNCPSSSINRSCNSRSFSAPGALLSSAFTSSLSFFVSRTSCHSSCFSSAGVAIVACGVDAVMRSFPGLEASFLDFRPRCGSGTALGHTHLQQLQQWSNVAPAT